MFWLITKKPPWNISEAISMIFQILFSIVHWDCDIIDTCVTFIGRNGSAAIGRHWVWDGHLCYKSIHEINSINLILRRHTFVCLAQAVAHMMSMTLLMITTMSPMVMPMLTLPMMPPMLVHLRQRCHLLLSLSLRTTYPFHNIQLFDRLLRFLVPLIRVSF